LLFIAVVFLHRAVLLRLGSKDFQWVQTVGIFLAIITILMLVRSSAVMFDSWQAIKGFEKCSADYIEDTVSSLENNDSGGSLLAELKYQGCKDSFYQVTGSQVPSGQTSLTTRQAATAFVGPVAEFFFWAGLFVFSLFLVFNKSIVIPFEEVESVVRSFKRR
jgi:hypothetical protein